MSARHGWASYHLYRNLGSVVNERKHYDNETNFCFLFDTCFFIEWMLSAWTLAREDRNGIKGRIARNTRDLLSIVSELTEKKVEFVSLKESIDTATPQGRFMLTVFGAVAELEREYILQRQREGIDAAKKQGIISGAFRENLKNKYLIGGKCNA